MRLATRSIIEGFLGLAALALIAALVVPWKEPGLPGSIGPNPSLSPSTTSAPASAAVAAAPDDVLTIFIGKPAVHAAPAPAPAKPPIAATWLRYLGRSKSPEGVTWVFLKDTRTGKLIQASAGDSSDGWTIVQDQDGTLVLKNGVDVYSVVKR